VPVAYHVPSSTSPDTAVEQTSSSREKITIWLIEDNLRFRQNIAELINNAEGIQCTRSFESCEEALQELEHSDAPRVILMDIGLPGMSGIDGVRRIKKMTPTTDIVMLTIYDDDDKVFEAICAGASGYLLKDAAADSILAAIGEVVQGGAPMNAHIARRMINMFTSIAVPRSDYGLTAREREILHLLTDGLTKRQIADRLFLSFFTIDTHVRNIYAKLHVHSRSGVVAKVLRERLL
jgi:DNA-binding NarL/FixJ family response regulator